MKRGLGWALGMLLLGGCSGSDEVKIEDACVITVDGAITLCEVEHEVAFDQAECATRKEDVLKELTALNMLGLAPEPDSASMQLAEECPLESDLTCHNGNKSILLYGASLATLDSAKQKEPCVFWN